MDTSLGKAYTELPPRVRLEDARASHDVVSHPEEVEDGFRETQWLLRASAG